MKNFLRYGTPKILCRKLAPLRFKLPRDNNERKYVLSRVDYYNKLNGNHCLPNETITLANFKLPRKRKHKPAHSAYFFDTYEHSRYFDNSLKMSCEFGDITHVPNIPSIVKSRPVGKDNANAILLNLDKARHFVFLNDRLKFADKKNLLIGRAAVYKNQTHRVQFYEMFFGHPMCNLGQVNRGETDHPEWFVEPLSIDQHLDYKFILCLEGNDVATNLKWVMSSNSLAVMPRPRYETWFMEGSLIADYHYVEIDADYSNLEEKLRYYIQHPDLAQAIVEHAHEHVNQFKNKKREKLIAFLTLAKYFKLVISG
ncbi:MAG: lipopolysaccharide biosynthesis protein [Prevotellaceae bacterium]|nr:lipopolysaccharide biosynthesis protein [Prevotellaceae bacterium]